MLIKSFAHIRQSAQIWLTIPSPIPLCHRKSQPNPTQSILSQANPPPLGQIRDLIWSEELCNRQTMCSLAFNPKRLYRLLLTNQCTWSRRIVRSMMGFVSHSQTRFIRNPSSCQKNPGNRYYVGKWISMNRHGAGEERKRVSSSLPSIQLWLQGSTAVSKSSQGSWGWGWARVLLNYF